ncbi:hypothetical protein SADUNF_Sadunf02G0010700 [Salix dunnii]|uniref:Transmembrane protein n=1 Tax=Salix dunnii TaxID=1413687 RepID=A0A835TI03_9ROSI|nr:hypothetical protein SADUNF_Sadunf02G0010700 [Salix dunnii]
MVVTTLASISSSVNESTGNPTEIAINASTSTSFEMPPPILWRRKGGLPLISVKKRFLRRRFLGGGAGNVELGFWGGCMGSEESSWESETGASSVVFGSGDWVSDEGGMLVSGEFWWSLRSVSGDEMDVVVFVIWELVIIAFLVFSAVSLYFRHTRLAFILVCITMLLLLCMKITKQVRLARKKKRRMLLPLSM